MALLRRPTVSTDLENIDTGVNSKAKSHVTLRRAVLEEIGNRVTTRATQVAKKAQNTKVPVLPTKTTNVNKQVKPTASVKPVQMKMLAPKTFHHRSMILLESEKKKNTKKQKKTKKI